MTRRIFCGGCGDKGLQPFLDLGDSPLADRFPATANEPEDRYPLRVAVCPRCWLVQLLDVVPDGMLYGADYAFFTGSSPSAVAYFADYADWLDQWLGLDGKLVYEVASNDGTLLRELARRGGRVIGIEPAGGPADAARASGLRVHSLLFGRQAAEVMRSEYAPADVIVANNVAAHVADLDDFFGGLGHLLAVDGTAVIEVQYVGDLLAGNQFDHVYHEHRYYFGIESLGRVLSRHGLWIRHVERTPAQGGSIRIAATRGKPPHPMYDSVSLLQPSIYLAFQQRADQIRERLLGLIGEQIAAGHKIAGYAASAKSATLLNYCGLGPDRIDHIVDLTPHKIGRYTPGTRIPIVAPGERAEPDVMMLLAWNYLSGVLRRERGFLDRGGRFLVPIPYPVLL